MPPCRDVLMPAPTKRDPHAVAVSTAVSRRRHQFSHASHNRWTHYLIPAMETGVSSVTGKTLAATRMALPHGCSGWGGDGWNDTLQPRVQLRLTANKQIMCVSVSVVDDYMISSGADCLRYRSGQDFRSISRYCLIDSNPNVVVW